MGIIKAAAGSVGGVMADQWLEIYTCDSMPNDVLAMRGRKKESSRSSNTKGDNEVISDGSLVLVADGQCAIAVDHGEIIGVFREPGENVYHSDRSKSLFSKGGVKGILKQSWDRFGYGGVAAVYQIIMYIDMKEHRDNAFRVSRAVNIKDRGRLTEMDISVSMSGLFSFRIADPVAFYKNVCGNANGTVRVGMVLPQLQAELSNGLGVAMSGLCAEGALSPTDISEATDALSEKLAAALTERWTAQRGFAVTSLAIEEVSISPSDLQKLQGLERDRAFTDPTMAAAHLTGAHGDAMRIASANPAGRAAVVTAVSAPVPPNSPANNAAWRCACGREVTTKFCEYCGRKRPQ